jgi:hypothetical protein
MYCKKCGRQIPNGAATCPNCGASVAEMLQPTAQPGAQTGNQQEQAEHNWFDAGAGKESITGAKKPTQNKGWSNDEFYNRQNQPAPAAQQENLSVSNLCICLEIRKRKHILKEKHMSVRLKMKYQSI